MKANKTKTVKKYSHIETRTNNPTLLQYGAPCYGVRLFYSQRKMSVIKTKIKLLFPKTLLPWHVLCKVPKSITYSLAHRPIIVTSNLPVHDGFVDKDSVNIGNKHVVPASISLHVSLIHVMIISELSAYSNDKCW